MKSLFGIVIAILIMTSAQAANRIKDLVTIKGVRENPLIGYGLVIGLNGTGDGGGEITNSSLKRMFQKLGLNPQREVSSKNVAAVIVTASLLPFARAGQKIDVTVSSIGDASSLAGGTLLMTPMKAGDGSVYAVASGQISIGGLEKGAKFPTTGRIANGATVEQELELSFNKKKALRLNLKNPDFTTAARIEKVINTELGGKFAIAADSSTIDLIIPSHYQRKVVELIALVENYKVNTDSVAQVVINERTGTVVAGGDVTLKEAAISHGDLVIEIKGEGGGGNNKKSGKAVHFVKQSTSLNDLVKALNALGATPEDIIAIFQALKQNGSLIGDLKFI
ncbi:MAG: flagellar basal body P-ring protein FlgI [Bacteriovoracia bacterium]